MKLHLIEDARKAWRFVSMQVTAAWAALFGLFAADPTVLETIWDKIPTEIQEQFPPWVRWLVVFSAIFGSVFLARIAKQPKLKNEEQPQP